MRTSARAHYVKRNHATRVPRAYVYLDTEAHNAEHGRRAVQTFRCGVAAFDAKRQDGDGWRDRQWCKASDPRELWGWITARCRAKARTVLVCHNLAYDVRISRAFDLLPALGWSFKMGRLDAKQAWLVWHRDGRTLFMVDSLSWVPHPLERLGELCELPKLPLPAWADDDEAWFARCERDVLILADVWRRLMAWVESEDLGNWKPSGAGQSWAALRHRFMRHDLLVHEDDDARAAERAAAHTGRCEVWRHGRLSPGPFTEWDFETAYCQIGAECAVPAQYMGEIVGRRRDLLTRPTEQRAYLADVTVRTDVPTVPVRTDDGIVWPVGTFTTTLWNNEVGLAIDNGADVQITRAWVYRTFPVMGDFCRWILHELHPATGHPDPIVRAALKHWSRAAIGRTAAQWPRWERWGTSPEVDVRLSTVIDYCDTSRWELLQLGRELWRKVGTDENPDAMVSVMSWIMAEARVRLWRAMQTAGMDHVCYVDTDSLFVDAAGDEALRAARIPGLRVKGVYGQLECWAPRQIVPAGKLRASGVPKRNVRVGERVFEADVWSGLASSLRKGAAHEVEIDTRTFRLSGRDRRRAHLAGSVTAPLTLTSA